MSEQIALEATGVFKRYAGRDVLSDVALVARAGRLHGLLGPNGAGKTTLMRVLLGLVPRERGVVRLLGRPLDSTAAMLPDGVAGFVETPALYPYLTARRNLELLARLDGCRHNANGSISSVLEQVGLAAAADREVAGYSAGMRQRLGLAAALLRSPRLLLLDEPTTSLDPAASRDVRGLLSGLADQGVAVVLSSHDMSEVEELCSNLTIIHQGQVVFCGTADQLRARMPAAVHAMHTSDDPVALDLAGRLPGVDARLDKDGGLSVAADTRDLDAYVVALGRAGIAVRSLAPRARSLEALFLRLTEPGPAEPQQRASSTQFQAVPR